MTLGTELVVFKQVYKIAKIVGHHLVKTPIATRGLDIGGVPVGSLVSDIALGSIGAIGIISGYGIYKHYKDGDKKEMAKDIMTLVISILGLGTMGVIAVDFIDGTGLFDAVLDKIL